MTIDVDVEDICVIFKREQVLNDDAMSISSCYIIGSIPQDEVTNCPHR